MRNFILAANWKMHKNPKEAVQFFHDYLPKHLAFTPERANGSELRAVVFVPALVLESSLRAVQGSSVQIGGQNIHHEIKGAFTGENSAAVLKSMGADWALVGHSERRTLFGETDEQTGSKMKTAIDNGLMAMLCVGETLAEREAGETIKVVARQLEAGLAQISETVKVTPKRIAIAYEPVWAIGTGKVATPDQATEVHQSIRHWLASRFDNSVAKEISILYGGSVKPDNAASIAAKPDIDGFLVGGASLEPASFAALC